MCKLRRLTAPNASQTGKGGEIPILNLPLVQFSGAGQMGAAVSEILTQ